MIRKLTFRAGNVKCRRCKSIFYRERGASNSNCPSCNAHCCRCNAPVDKAGYCAKCKKEIGLMHHGKDAVKARNRDAFLYKTYGITSPEYEAILSHQNGVCWICGEPPTKKRLAVDHQHVLKDKQSPAFDKRKRVRGLLCWRCNASIINKHDDPNLLRRAADYLEEWPAQEILNQDKKDTGTT